MKVIQTTIPGVLIVEPKVYGDDRGFFMESYSKQTMEQLGISGPFVQDNHSRSSRNVLRGLHYQTQRPQGKLVRVVSGSVFDVAVDIRPKSEAFGRWFGIELTEENRRMLWIPPGLAHGFLVLSETADFLYKTTDYYAPQYERSILWSDPNVGIQWPLKGEPKLSEKDKVGSLLAEANLYGISAEGTVG